MLRCLPLFLLLIITGNHLHGQEDSLYVIDTILFSGNEKTSSTYLRKELSIKQGDSLTLESLREKIRENQELLAKTSLFVESDISVHRLESDKIEMLITLRERFYLLPTPYLALSDRNFNEWWEEYDHDLHRLIYGLTIYLDNINGWNQQLKAGVFAGFNQRLEIGYKQPFFSANSNIGWEAGLFWQRTRDLAYDIRKDKLTFLKEDHFIMNLARVDGALRYQPNPFSRQWLCIRYQSIDVDPMIAALNPEYLGRGKTGIRFLTLAFEWDYNKTDHPSYPLRGRSLNMLVRKDGLGFFEDMDHWVLSARYEKYLALSRGFFTAHAISGSIALNGDLPYFYRPAIGYEEDFIRGNELYVVKGEYFFLNRNALKYNFWSFIFKSSLIPMSQFQSVPFDLYLTTHFDHGYVGKRFKTHENELPNHWLYGFGVGLDIVTYYDYYMSISYSFNQSGEKGLFLHFNL